MQNESDENVNPTKPEEDLRAALEGIKSVNSYIQEDRRHKVDRFKERHSEIQRDIDKLMQTYIEGGINKTYFYKEYNKLSRRRLGIVDIIAEFDAFDDEEADSLIEQVESVHAKYEAELKQLSYYGVRNYQTTQNRS